MQTITVVQLRDSVRQAGPQTNALAAPYRGALNHRETSVLDCRPQVRVG